MANPWFKFYGPEYLGDQKILQLSASKRSCWITLLAYVSASSVCGAIRHLTEEQLMIQSGIRYGTEEWESTKGVLKDFERLKMVRIDNEIIRVKNWKKRQETNLTGYERVKRYRKKQKDNANDNASITSDKNREEENRKDKKPTGVQEVVNYLFTLKGWADKDKDFYSKNHIVYSRFTRSAKELLELCEGDAAEAKRCLDKMHDWASSRDLDWGIETIFKKWYDLDLLKPKEKKPYYEGKRIFQRNQGGRWYCVSRDGVIRELGLVPAESKIEWK